MATVNSNAAELVEDVPTGATIDRTTYLGASEIAAVCGVGYKSALDVWAAKTGLVNDSADTAASHVGKVLERPTLEEIYAPRAGVHLTYPGTVRHHEEPWIAATPDGIGDERIDVQCKVVGYRQAHRWGDEAEGIGGVPDEVVLQVHWEMLATELQLAHVFFNDTATTEIYTVPRDGALIQDMVEIGRDFWETCVIGRKMPDPVGRNAKSILERHYGPVRRPLLDAPDGAEAAARTYQEASRAAAEAYEVKDEAGNRLRAMIGEAEGFKGDWGKATWKSQAGRVDWKRLAESLEPAKKQVEAFRGPGQRVLRVHLKGER
jgi:putative phage-type endonuclease